MLFFGSEARNAVDAAALEPVDLFHHLTQLSMPSCRRIRQTRARPPWCRPCCSEWSSSGTTWTRPIRCSRTGTGSCTRTPNRSALDDAQQRMLTSVECDLCRRELELVEPAVGEHSALVDPTSRMDRCAKVQSKQEDEQRSRFNTEENPPLSPSSTRMGRTASASRLELHVQLGLKLKSLEFEQLNVH